MIKKALLIGIFFFYAGNLFCMQGIKVLEVSSSGSSIIVDRGSLEGVAEGQSGQFYYQVGDISKPRLYFIGEAEVIKVHSASSFWFFKNIENFQFLKKGKQILFARNRIVLEGRRKYRIREKRVLLTRAKSLSEYVDDRDRGLPKELVFKEDEYRKSQRITKELTTVDYDIKQIKYQHWKKRGNPEFSENYLDEIETVFIDQSNKGVKPDAIRAAIDKEIARSTVEGAVAKVNESGNGLAGIYKYSRPERSSSQNSFTKAMAPKRKKRISNIALEKIQRDGARWSADMEDDQLRRFFIKTGIAEEKDRQRRALTEKFGHELNFKIFSDVDSVTTPNDPNNTGIGYALNISYEIPLKGSVDFFRSFSFEIGLEQGNTFFAMNSDINVRLKYGDFRGFLNWYFWNEPISIRKLIWFVGAGVARGNGTALSSELFQEYKMSILSLPLYQGGVKYRFRAGDMDGELLKIGIGLGMTFSYGATKYSILDSVSSNDNINGTKVINRFKVAFGMSAYF